MDDGPSETPVTSHVNTPVLGYATESHLRRNGLATLALGMSFVLWLVTPTMTRVGVHADLSELFVLWVIGVGLLCAFMIWARPTVRRNLVGSALQWIAIAIALLAFTTGMRRALQSDTFFGTDPHILGYCQSHLREIGIAILLHTNENKGQYPKTLGELVQSQGLEPSSLVCFSSNDGQGCNLPYVYLGAGLTTACHPDTVVAYERVGNHSGRNSDGMNVLFADGHVQFVRGQAAQRLMARINTGTFPVVPAKAELKP